MIYKKDANFPYPVLTNTSNSYESGGFTLSVDLKENTDTYRFDIEYEVESDFLQQLLAQKQAQLFLIIQSKDNKFFKLQPMNVLLKLQNHVYPLTRERLFK